MVTSYKRGEAIKLNDLFDTSNFDCKCVYPECEITLIDSGIVDVLTVLSNSLGHININSGFRCHRHNADIGGKTDSQHLLGRAADIWSPSTSIEELINLSESIESIVNGGLGIYKTFIHIDTRGCRARW